MAGALFFVILLAIGISVLVYNYHKKKNNSLPENIVEARVVKLPIEEKKVEEKKPEEEKVEEKKVEEKKVEEKPIIKAVKKAAKPVTKPKKSK
jgi:hypothetical protein